jgi:hypothetical protein
MMLVGNTMEAIHVINESNSIIEAYQINKTMAMMLESSEIPWNPMLHIGQRPPRSELARRSMDYRFETCVHDLLKGSKTLLQRLPLYFLVLGACWS